MALSLDDLCAIEEIKQLKARYFRFADTKMWEDLRTVFTDDVTFDYRGAADKSATVNVAAESTNSIKVGIDEVMQSIISSTSNSINMHQGHTPEIKITDADNAEAIWQVFARMIIPDGSELVFYGYYYETYRRVSGEWKIRSGKLESLRTETRPAS